MTSIMFKFILLIVHSLNWFFFSHSQHLSRDAVIDVKKTYFIRRYLLN